MKKQNTLSCLLLAGVLFLAGESTSQAQASQTGTTVSPGAAVPLTAFDPSATSTTPQLPAVFGAPGASLSGIASGAQSSSSGAPSSGASDDPCSSSLPDRSSIVIEPDPLGVAPGGGADQLTEPSPSIRAKNPAIKKCEGGRIIVRVESKRFYGYHIGDELPLSIQIVADDGVQLNFDSLNQQIVGFNGSDYQLIPVRAVSIASHPYSGRPHSTLYGIELSVQTFVTKPILIFNLDLKYALDVPPGVKQPNWRVLTTPDFITTNTPVITTSNDDEVEDGDLSPADFRSSWLQWPLMVTGLFMAVWFAFLRTLIVRLNRMRPGRVIPPEETAWAVFDRIFSDARDYGEFGAPYLRNIEATLRSYLAQTSKMKIKSLTIKEISSLMEDDPRLPIIVSVLKKCESVIYARVDQPVKLTESQIKELYDELQDLVPSLRD
jgi:hypothetical protein